MIDLQNDNGLEDEALQELLDLFYADSARANLIKFGIWRPAEEKGRHRKTRST